MHNKTSRRNFVKQSGILAGGLFALPAMGKSSIFSTSSDPIRVAVIGCGGRGTGAAVQALQSGQNVQIVALADAFEDNVRKCYQTLTDENNYGGNVDLKQAVNVPAERQFWGFDGFRKAIPLADVIILATPPGFRPMHFEECISQNKHVFMEKPVATDPAGVKKVLEVAEKAKAKKRNVVVGLQRRYQTSYLELFANRHLIGDMTSAQAWWNGAGVWVRKRQPQQTEMEYQMRNWYYFVWLCGDHIVEQHIHNIDSVNWFKGDYPVKAQGMGGREVRKGKDYGEIFDHHYVEFEYADGTILNSQCRHIPHTASRVDELMIGTKGRIMPGSGKIVDLNGKTLFQFNKRKDNDPYQQEQTVFLQQSLRGNLNTATQKTRPKVHYPPSSAEWPPIVVK